MKMDKSNEKNQHKFKKRAPNEMGLVLLRASTREVVVLELLSLLVLLVERSMLGSL